VKLTATSNLPQLFPLETALGVANRRNFKELATLLGDYQKNPFLVRAALQKKFKINDIYPS